MHHLDNKIWNKHQFAVVFAHCENSPEDFVFSLQESLKNTSIVQALVICHVLLQQPWSENSQQLEISYLLLQKQGQLQIDKVSVAEREESTGEVTLSSRGEPTGEVTLSSRGEPTGDSAGSITTELNNKTITVNFDKNFYFNLKKQFYDLPFLFSLDELFVLDPVYIPKPWGQEIWYTGVEKRGVSKIAIANTTKQFSIPLTWFFIACPKSMLGEKYANKSLVLIKILDPLPDEVVGDLYYELHQEKNEVYVVTDISAKVGRIKMGINQDKLEQYKNNIPQLKQDFLEAIEKYEVIRRKIDVLEDKSTVPQEWSEQELQLRNSMDEFAGYIPLQVGDVIAVPTFVPHALQHGVKVIEFQTPTYERLIISFAQKVLTQNHWDTKLALNLMNVQGPKKEELKKLENTKDYQVELVCKFLDFYATRVCLNSSSEYNLKVQNFYQILFLINGSGDLNLNEKTYFVTGGQCLFIPACCSAALYAQKNEMVFLVCAGEQF